MKTHKTRLLLMLLSVSVATPVSAEIVQVRPGLFAAGVPSAQFDFFAARGHQGRQRQQNWCWAACVQMTLNYHGLRVSQEEVVQRVFGAQVDRPGTPQMILAALSGWAPDQRGRYSVIHATPYVMRGSTIVRDLANRWPLIIGLRGQPVGHAYVLTGVYYTVNPYNNEPVFQHVILRDPWPGRPSRVEVPWVVFQQKLMFMARVSVSRL